MPGVARVSLSVLEAAYSAGVSRSLIYEALKDKVNPLKSSKLGGRRVIRVADLDAWVAAGAETSRK